MSRKRLSSVAQPFLGLALAVSVLGLAADPVRADGPAPHPRTARFEIKFMKGMIDHHMMAVMMAELCEDRAVHEELLTLCGNIIETQTAEIEQMQSWLHDWYGIDYEPRMTGKMRKQVERLAGLSGEEFEIQFMMMMIEHHAEAIEEAQDCAERASHEQLVELCENIIEAQSEEIALMQAWLCDWYDICENE